MSDYLFVEINLITLVIYSFKENKAPVRNR